MRYAFGGAAALAVLSFTSITNAQDENCPYTPIWEECLSDPDNDNSDYECATISVPRNWFVNDDQFIPLPLIRYPLRDTEGEVVEDAKSIIMNPGYAALDRN